MKRNALIIMSAFLAALFSCGDGKDKKMVLEYPHTKKVDARDTLYGTIVEDPYRWLEHDTARDVKAWVEAQNEVTFGYLESIPFRDKVKERLTDVWNYPRYSAPFKKNDLYFYFHNDGLQDYSVLYMTHDPEKDGEVLLDPNGFSEDGTVSLASMGISDNGKYLAYGISRGGSDWNEVFVKDIETGEMLDDHLKWIKFSGISWQGDGFYYSRYDAPEEGAELSASNEYHKVYYHQLGTSQKDDRLVYWNPQEPRRNYTAGITDDERFLIIYESAASQGNAMYYKDLELEGSNFHRIAPGFDHQYRVVDHKDGHFIVRTNYGAPRYRLVLMDPHNPDPEHWQDILPEKESVLRGATLAGGRIVASYMEDATSRAYVYEVNGTLLHEIELPGIGSLGGFSGDKEDNEGFYTFSSYNMPSAIYRYDVEDNRSELFRRSEIDFNSDDYETRQIFYESKDGTKVPMFITYKKGLEMDGNNPVYLYGYGGFNVSLTPRFRMTMIPFLENGGIYAVVNLRGGGEYGEEWHQAGTKLQKQNVFDDFIAAAEYLIDQDYTRPERIAIAGGSNGGLLVGACMIQRPDLFGVALPAVGVMDMLRYHKFTIGWHWAGDYGTVDDSEEMFRYLLGYSPLHTLEKGVEYPATMVTTADHDDRVVPAHSFKFIAALQEMHEGQNPVLIRIETKAGHGAGKSTEMMIEETTDVLSFLFYNMDIKPKF